jgi:translation initiation factor 2 gamma subunit (eIF-2gamma)
MNEFEMKRAGTIADIHIYQCGDCKRIKVSDKDKEYCKDCEKEEEMKRELDVTLNEDKF